jgi:hypothetical protein
LTSAFYIPAVLSLKKEAQSNGEEPTLDAVKRNILAAVGNRTPAIQPYRL